LNQVRIGWDAPGARTRGSSASGRGGWRPGLLIAALFAGSTLLTPLYPTYEKTFGFGPLVLTLVYGAYVLGNLSALLWLGRLSDRLGRRPIGLAALAIAAVSTLAFLFARGPWTLGAGRVLAGLGVGLGSGAGAAWIAELAKGRGKADPALVTTVVNFLGLAGGAVAAGLLAQFAPAPLKLVFLAYLAVLAVSGWALATAAETVRRAGPLGMQALKPRLGVPKPLRGAFVAPAIAIFVSMAMVGFYAALAPNVTAKILGAQSPALAGGVVAEFCVVTTAAILASRRLSARTAVLAGLALVPPALALMAAAGPTRSLAVQAIGAALGGAAVAFAYRGSLQAINAMAPPDRRAELVSSYLACGFLGNALPVIGVGALNGPLGAETAAWVFAATLSLLAIAALVGTLARKPD
jgi:MFS family permease